MFKAQGFFAGSKGAPIEWLGLPVAALLIVEIGEILERQCQLWIVGAEPTCCKLNGALGDGDCLGIPSGFVELHHFGV
jgi:hypothetical protein